MVREFREFSAIFTKNRAPSVRHIKPDLTISPHVSYVLFMLCSSLTSLPVSFVSLVRHATFIFSCITTDFVDLLFSLGLDSCPRLCASITFRDPLRVQGSP